MDFEFGVRRFEAKPKLLPNVAKGAAEFRQTGDGRQPLARSDIERSTPPHFGSQLEMRSEAAEPPAVGPAIESALCLGRSVGNLLGRKSLGRRRPRTRVICPVTRASSTGRCNTFQCIDDTMLPRENHVFGGTRSKPNQGGVSAGLTPASDFGFCFQCQAASSLVLRRPIEITELIKQVELNR
jgi:hypothetical protein